MQEAVGRQQFLAHIYIAFDVRGIAIGNDETHEAGQLTGADGIDGVEI
ncbi:hypothetical protein GCM10007417_13640 [Glycocaulis alkaliphilus]|nr:hypothetical protein GCM10007417_13640 [Glycocaulis alkaliphilus]